LILFSTTAHVDPDLQAELVSAFAEIDKDVTSGDQLERKGVGSEVWTFFLDVDWAVVRDSLMSGAIAAGAVSGGKAVKVAAKKFAKLMKKVQGIDKSGGNGEVVIRCSRTRAVLLVNSDHLDHEEAWVQALEGEIVERHLRWDPLTKVWIDVTR
jgi:hypothetical protein